MAATQALLQQLLPLPATPEAPICVYYRDSEPGAQYRGNAGLEQLAVKNKKDIQAALAGLSADLTHVGPVSSGALARTLCMKTGGKEDEKAMLETAKLLFPQVAHELR